MKNHTMTSRRNFVKNTAIAGAALTTLPGWGLSAATTSLEERLRVGLIGVGLRGTNHLNNLLLRSDCLVTAICDIDPKRIEIALGMISKAGQKKPKVFENGDYDYRNLLDLKEVDAVIISTPWLWHTRMAKDSMWAGKYTGLAGVPWGNSRPASLALFHSLSYTSPSTRIPSRKKLTLPDEVTST